MQDWKTSARTFFDERAYAVQGVPTLDQLCLISGRDPRMWKQPGMYDDLIDSIISQAGLNPQSKVLEVGCASGFLARGVAPRVGQYHGVDLAKQALSVAKRLRLPNASYRQADGTKLPFADHSYDAAFCYDVFTNLPDIAIGEAIIAEMLRVVKPGGLAMVGSIPDGAAREGFEAVIPSVAAKLDATYGPAEQLPAGRLSLLDRLRQRFDGVKPSIVCYYFEQSDFAEIANRLGAQVTIADIHGLNPYKGFRFNAIFSRPAP